MLEWCTVIEKLRALDKTASWLQIREITEETQQVVSALFQREEQDGYLSEVLHESPERDHELDRLQSQHGDFLDRLENIQGWIRKEEDRERVLLKIEAWLLDFSAHEQQERALLQETFTTDLGFGD